MSPSLAHNGVNLHEFSRVVLDVPPTGGRHEAHRTTRRSRSAARRLLVLLRWRIGRSGSATADGIRGAFVTRVAGCRSGKPPVDPGRHDRAGDLLPARRW